MEQIIINITAKDMTDAGVKSAEKNLSSFEQSMNKTQSKINKLDAKMNISAVDKASSVVESVKSKASGLTSKIWNASVGIIDKVTSPLKGILNMFKNPLFTAGAIIGVSLSLGNAINTYADFEATMSKVSALSGTTGSAMDSITEKAKQIGLNTKFTAKEAGDAFTYMAMAGWKSEQMLAGIDGVINLTAASGEDLATVSDIVTDDLTAFGMQASEAGHFADVLAAAATNSNTNVSMMGETFKYVGPLAGTMGYSIEDMAIAVGLMANSSIKGSQAGTALKNTIANMAAPTDTMAAAMSELGISLTDSSGKVKSFRTVMDELRASYSGLGKADQVAKASEVFGKYGMSGMLAVINATEEDYKSLTTAIDNADGSAKRMADTMQDNLRGSMIILQSATQGTLMSLGERLAPYARAAADWATENMQYVERFISQIMDKVDVYIEQAKSKIAEFTSTDDWFNADIFGKAKIAWDELIGNPLGEWWNSSGKSAFSGIAKSIGSGLGSVLSTGLMSLLGIDISSAASEGMSIGASFAEGFASKFDLGEIISKAVKSHPIISSLIGLKMGSSILGAGKSVFSTGKSIVGGIGVLGAGIASAFSSYKNGGVKSVLSNLKTIFTGSGTGSAVGNTLSTVSAMTITAGVVNLNGSVANAATSGQSGYYQVRRARASAQNAETLAQNAPVPTPSLGKYVIQDKAGNTIGGTNSFMQAGLAKTGVFLGSGATTVGGAALAGTAGIAGAVVAGGTLLSAVSDFYHAEKSNNAEEKAAYNASSSIKLGGVAAGAATGAAIGSVIPVVGTVIGGLVGAGIGGLAGSAIGNNMKKSFEKAKVESEELKAAIDDDEASAEDLQRALESACSQNLRKHFGNIKLTLQEISTAAKDITLGSKVKEFEKFSEAVNSVEQSYEGLSSAQKDLEKSVWKINVGVQFEEEDYTNFKQEIDNFISYGKTYLTDNQLEFQASVNLLLGDNGTGYKAYDGVNWMYTKLQNKFSENKLKFEQEYEVALKDGKIDTTEMANLQQYIDEQNSITEKISDAQNKAENEFTKQKFLGGSLSYDSFEELRGELKTNLESGIQTYNDAYKDTLENLYHALADRTIDDSQFQEMQQAALYARNSGVLSIRDNIKTVELDSFTEAYSKALDGVLPNLTGTTSEKLSQFLSKTNIQPLDTETIIEKLGLTNSNLSTEVQENIAGILKNIQLDLSVGDLLRPNGDTAAALSTQVEHLIGSAFTGDFSAFANSVGTSIGNSIDNNIGSANASISTAKGELNNNILSILGENTTVNKNVDVNINWNITNPNPPSLGGSSGDNSYEPNIVEKASGGFVNSATRFIAGEAGTEVIIPLSSSRRNRGIDLWEKAGKMLGVPYFADGGFVGSAYNRDAISDDDNDIPVFAEQNGQSINITIGANPAITINSDGGNVDILQVLKENLSDIADDILEQVAEALEGIFKNRPREA